MKNLILVIAVLLVGACATLSSEEQKVLGTYEGKIGGPSVGATVGTFRVVLLDDSTVERYHNGKIHDYKWKWSIVNGEIHTISEIGGIIIFRINKDGSITRVARIPIGLMKGSLGGKRINLTKENQLTFKIIK